MDAFDAMTSDRPYHRGVPDDLALAELVQSQGSQFNPNVVVAFRRALRAGERPPRWQFFAPLEE